MNYPPNPFAFSPCSPEPTGSDEDSQDFPRSRMYLSEPGWRIGVKLGSDREFCYARTPGQDFYHRLLDGEVYLQRAEEKLCVACASRRGLFAAEPKRLRESIIPIPADRDIIPLDLGARDAEFS